MVTKVRPDEAGPPAGCAPILTSTVAAELLAALEDGQRSVQASLDLGRSTSCVGLRGSGAVVTGVHVGKAALAEVAGEAGKCFEATTAGLQQIRIFSEATGWVRTLVPTADAPTTVVAGFAMHRLRDATPMTDTRAKVRALGTPRGRALDTATGLGYTAIALARTCASVVTVERDPAAIALAWRNPWSAELFDNPKVCRRGGDVAELVHEFDDGEFAVVLHDPPTAQLAGDLFGLAFYRQLRRVLRPGGRLFHYVGDPSSRASGRATAGVLRRLGEAGFVAARRAPRAFGVTAVAPRHGGRRRQAR